MSTVTNISNGGAEAELSRCQQMLSVVLFITRLAEKALYYYTLMQCQAATGAYNKPTALVRLIPRLFGPVHWTTSWDPAYIEMLHQSSLLSSNTAGSDWPDFSPYSSLHPNALMFTCVCVCTSLYVGVMEEEESISSRASSASPCLVLYREKNGGFAGPLQIVSSAWGMPFRLFVDLRRESHSSCSHHSG